MQQSASQSPIQQAFVPTSSNQSNSQVPPAENNQPPMLPVLPNSKKPPAEQLIYQWKSPSRPFKKRKRQFFTTVTIIVLLICLILFFAGQVLPIAVVISVAFLVYVMYTIPPGMSEHKITTYGIYSDDDFYPWDEIGRFWFDTSFDQEILSFEIAKFPGRAVILLGEMKKSDLEQTLDQLLVQERPPLTQFEQWARWLQDKVPLE